MSQQELAVVFVDMVSHSPYVAALTAGERRQFYGAFMETVEGLAEKFGAAERPSFTGDGYMLAFQSANVAVSFGLKLADQWQRLFQGGRLRQFGPVELRCGAHCGVPEVVRWNLVGPVCNIAKRVCDTGDGPGVLVTQAVLDHLDQAQYRWEDAGTHPLKGDHVQERGLYRVLEFLPKGRPKKMTAEDWFLRAVAMIGTPKEGTKEEEECYRQALRLKPDYPEAHYNYAILLAEMGRRGEAEAHLKEALRLRPDYPEAHNNYANLLVEMGRREEAEAYYKEALGLRPDFPEAHNNYAALLEDMGRGEEAEAHFKEALRLRPDDPDYHDHYAILLDEMGRTQEAAYHRREAERLRKEKVPGTQTGP